MVRGNLFSAKYVLLVLTDIFMWGKGGLRWREKLKEWLHPHWITSGQNPTVRIYIGPMGRDYSHRDWYKYSAGLN
jgi:hypothetical protein